MIKNKKFKINVLLPFVTMADIAFLLLIFLIITSSINNKKDNLKIEIPKSTQFNKIKNKNIIEIYITRNKNIIYNNNIIKYKKLKRLLPSNKKCIITCDENVNLKFVYKIMELLKSKNYQKVLFTVNRKNSKFN